MAREEEEAAEEEEGKTESVCALLPNMPTYLFSQLLQLEDDLCKGFPNLDLNDGTRSSPKSSVFKPDASSCSPMSGGDAVSSVSSGQKTEGRRLARPQSLEPPASLHQANARQWERHSLSLVEGDLGCTASDPKLVNHPTLHVVPSSASPLSSRYKTELCRTYAECGTCKYGAKCQFAHGYDELRGLARHPKYKTEPCRTFHTIGICPYGTRCHFVHNLEEQLQSQRPKPEFRSQRPPLLKQSFSFAGFPSVPFIKESSVAYTRVPSASPPPGTLLSEMVVPGFLESSGVFSLVQDEGLELDHFFPSPDSGNCSFYCTSPTECNPAKLQGLAGVFPLASSSQLVSQPPSALPHLATGSRSLSSTSLSDLEGGCSSSSSHSGSESPIFESCGRRLPIFSQLSVPEKPAEENEDRLTLSC
ncbi:mRNA decay activator protein ZFP36L1-like [Erpetoichthys calabaricus]|uniref:mRNA decay activator protein ZFP36L1-like n=1 Tax=Erpetoichthys calabaricus TaxID=27687 RepID=UPI0022344C7B|nr:mRNA decay activator protein ZFP36L1-like [Erpetoichthys calabaricus]